MTAQKFVLADLNDEAVLAFNEAEIAVPPDRTVEIERIAALDAAQYETVRNEVAGKLGFRASVLDNYVMKSAGSYTSKMAKAMIVRDGRLPCPRLCRGSIR